MLIAPLSLLPILTLLTAPEAPVVQTADATPVVMGEEEVTYGWEGSIAVGGSLTDGNTDVKRGSITADGIRRREHDRLTLGLSWNYGEEDGTLTQRRTFARGQYDYFLSEKSYVLADASLQADGPAGLTLRTSVGAGYGRQVIDNETTKLGLEAGVAYISEDLEGAPVNNYLAARLGYDLFWQATDAVEFQQHVKAYPSLEEKDDFFGQVDSRVKLTLTEKMFAQFQWVLDYNNTPAAGRDRVDNLFLVALGWSF